MVGLILNTVVGGCVMMVVPLPPFGTQRGTEEIESLQVGVSTREEVRQALGSPSRLVGDRRYEIFELSEEDFNLFWLLAIGMGGGGGVSPVGESHHRMLVEYGPDEVLRSLHWEAIGDLPSDAPAPSAETAREISTWERPERSISSVAVAPSGRYLAVDYSVRPDKVPPSATSLMQVRDRASGELLQEIENGPPGCPQLSGPGEHGRQSTAFLSDGIRLANIARDGVVCIWDPTTQRGVVTLNPGKAPVTHLAAARTAPILASGHANELVKVWNGTSGLEVTSISPCSVKPGCIRGNALALSDDGRLLATAQRPRTVTLWDAVTGTELAEITQAPAFPSPRLALSSAPERLAIHLGDHVQIWRLRQAAPAESEGVPRPSDVTVELEQVLLLPYGCSDSRRLTDGSTVFAFPSEQPSLGFSHDGTRFAAGEGSVVVWETASWRQIWRADAGCADSRWDRGFVLTLDGGAIVTDQGIWQLPGPSEGRNGPEAKSDPADEV
ncbi:MAG TPA: WD40 repeat domain-containing protein [Geminicoccaceae bacterium]|nr:WD40 repeat domain-containing protein [Geminicoccaceae bacterium]